MISYVRIKHIRNHRDSHYSLSPITVLYGNNGVGKTAVLEAIHIALMGTSFKGTDKDVVQYEKEWYKINLTSNDPKMTREVRYINQKKQFIIDTKISARLGVKQKFPIILFTPDDLRLISGSPARRRQYIDQLICQIEPHYTGVLRRYERALMQRNKLLKADRPTRDSLFPWNIILSDTGAQIINLRNKYLAILDKSLEARYNEVAGSANSVKVLYTHTPTQSTELLGAIEKSFDADVRYHTTTIGPHRHDFTIRLNHHDADTTASRGEIRTLILSLKSTEAGMIETVKNISPVILLDDVYGELDNERQQMLLVLFRNKQLIITSTHPLQAVPTQTIQIEIALSQTDSVDSDQN